MIKIMNLKWFSAVFIVVLTTTFPLNTAHISDDFTDIYLFEAFWDVFFTNYKYIFLYSFYYTYYIFLYYINNILFILYIYYI